MKLWAGIYFPKLGIEIFEKRISTHTDRPIVLIENNKVQLLNDQAEIRGIRKGNNIATAYSLVTNLMHFEKDHSEEQIQLKKIAALAYRYTPLVSISEPSVLLLDVAKSLRLFGGLRILVKELGQSIDKLGHSASLGISHTPLGAIVLAKSQKTFQVPKKVNDFPNPEQLKQLSMDSLSEVSIRHTKLEKKTIERLSNMGIFQLGKLFQLPRKELGRRFNKSLIEYLDKLTGTLPDPQLFETPHPKFHSSLHLMESVMNKQTLIQPMKHLTDELMHWLNIHQLRCSQITWSFKSLSGAHQEIEVKFSLSRSTSESILNLSSLTLDKAEMPEEVISIILTATNTELLNKSNFNSPHLFGAPFTKDNPPGDFIDQIIARMGKDCLQNIQCHEDHRPEYAWSPGIPTSHLSSNHKLELPFQFRHRPLWLLEPARNINPRKLELINGPERLDGGWWETHTVRDYFIARNQHGSLCWVYRNTNGWFLHGYFS